MGMFDEFEKRKAKTTPRIENLKSDLREQRERAEKAESKLKAALGREDEGTD